MAMRLNKVTIHNFGPYQGPQSLSFGDKRPIVLVHGANMRGKTSLLNSIRWVLYGSARDRLQKTIPLTKLVNLEAATSGDWHMSVQLGFEVDGVIYHLERAVQPKPGVSLPLNDSHFEEKLFLKKGGHHLNRDEAETEINRVLPEQVSLFFLFDGELLNHYEILLADSDRQAQAIKDAIETILGVPALTHAVADLRSNLKDAAKRQHNLAKKDKAAQVYATQAAALANEIEGLEQDLAELENQRDQRIQNQHELDQQLQATASVEADAQNLHNLSNQIKQIRETEKQFQLEKREQLVDAWRDLLQPCVEARVTELEAELNLHLKNLREAGEIQARLHDVQHLSSTGVCPVCQQSVVQSSLSTLETRQVELQDKLATLHFDEQRISHLGESIQKLRNMRPSGVMSTIAYIEQQLRHLRVNLADLEFKYDEVNERLKRHDQSVVVRNRHDYIEVTKEIGVLERTIADKKQAILEKQALEKTNRAMIGKTGGPELVRLNREVQMYEELIALFLRAIDRLRDNLRRKVEQDATEIFRQLTTDKTYKGLRINERYGLTILDATGGEVQVRSAGAEQVVALSLIGALNRNAIRRGPIVMDTPFGRLDPKHRENILKFVPAMAEQITLLVHGGEIDRDRDLEHIKDKIDKEYTIEYVSSCRSELVHLKEA